MRLIGFIAAAGVLMIALWPTGLLHSLFHTIVTLFAALLGIVSGIVLYLSNGKQRVPQTPRLSRKTEQVSRYFASKMTVDQLVQKSYKQRTVVSRPLDKTIQEVFDFFIRDFCLSWFRDLGKDEAGFVDVLTEEFWAIIDNLVERLGRVDTVKFLSKDVVDVLCEHFQKLRMADMRNYKDNSIAFILHPCLTSREAERAYLSKYSEVLLYCLLPKKNSHCAILRYLLREILAFSVFQPLADLLCDPDYIYQTLLLHLEAKQKLALQLKQGYAYADTYEDFIKIITTCNSVEYLKQVRYHIIAEIMQATTINNLKGIDSLEHGEGGKSLKKDARLRSRDLKRYINQCTVAKGQCEKRIKLLGGPDYTPSHAAETKPVGQEKSHGLHKQNTAPAKMLSFIEIMDNSLARNFFMQFLENHTSSKNVLRFWMSIENLKLANHMELHKSAQEIYQVYVTPSSDKSIMLDTTLVRGMEDYLNGTKGLQCYFDAQKICYHSLEEKFYRKFVLSKEYTMFVCQAEAQMDDLRAQHGAVEALELNWTSVDVDVTDEENWQHENKPGRKPSTVEERSDSIVNKLHLLDQRLASKTQQLEIVRRSYGADVEEMEKIQGEIEKLITERRNLEFHIERTELWCENLGKWKIQIQNSQLSPDEEKSVPVYVIVVHSAVDSTSGAATEGWVVTRKLKDFRTLHSKLKECCSWLSKEVPLPSKKWYKSMDEDFLEKSRQSLELYLQNLLADEKLRLSEELYSFLSPSPEHLKKQSEPAKKTGFSLFSVLKSLPFDIIASLEAKEAEASMDQEDSAQRKDSIAEPFYALIGEVFELKGVFKWLRKTLIAFVQVTFGGNINKEIKKMVQWLVSESMIIYYIHNFRDSMWPGGTLAEPAVMRSPEQKLETKEKAKKLLPKNIPEVLQNLVGKRNSKLGTIKVFEAFQDIRVNKHLFYILFELCIMRLCPEVCTEEIQQKAKLLKSSRASRSSPTC